MLQNKNFDFSPEELKIFMSAGDGDAQRAAMQNLLKEKNILVLDYVLDDQGNIKQPPTPKKDNEGRDIYKFNESGLTEKEPSIAPVLSGNLTGRNDYFAQKPKSENGNDLIFRVNTDNERAKYLAMMEIENAKALTQQLKNSYAEKRAELIKIIGTEIVSALIEIAARAASGEPLDAEFWLGWAEIERQEGSWDEWVLRLLAYLGEALKLLDFFMADIINDPKQPITLSALESGLSTWRFESPPRTRQTRTSSRAVAIRDASGRFDNYLYEGNFIGSIDITGGKTFAVIGTNARMDIRGAEANLQAKRDEIQKLISPGGTGSALTGLDFNDRLMKLKLEEVQLESDLETAKSSSAEIDKLYKEHKKGEIDISFFDSIETNLEDVGMLMKSFENSLVFRTLIETFTNISRIIQSIKDEVNQIYNSIKSPIDLRNAAEAAYPNYELTYQYGKKYKIGESTQSKIYMLVNNSPLTSLTGSEYGETGSFIEFSEEIDKEAYSYIARNNLADGWSEDRKISFQQYVFDNYKAKKGIALSYKLIEKAFFDRLYSDVTSSLFFNSSIVPPPVSKIYPNIKYIDLKDYPTSIYDSACRIENNGLDLDDLKEDMLNDFKNNACNHQPPDPLGRRRDLMNPIENVISDTLMIATIRVYIYDYFTRALFLLDRYKLGMTATDPLLEILARYFESEMRSYSGNYYINFIENISSYHDRNYKESYRKLVLKYTDARINSREAKNEKFKKIFAEQMLYVSKKINKKINNAVEKMDLDIKSGLLRVNPSETFNEVRKKSNVLNESYSQLLKFFENGKSVGPFSVIFKKSTLPPKVGGFSTADLMDEQGKNAEGFILKYKDQDILEGKVNLPPSLETDEFKFLFEFCFPIRKYIGLVAFHCILSGGAYPNTAKTFLVTKGALKAKQNSLMDAKGILETNKDPAAVETKEGEATAEPNPWQEVLTRILWQIPRQTLKSLCEIADPNVFIASLPYNLMRLFTVPFLNQIPHIPISQGVNFLGISGQAPNVKDLPPEQQNHKIGLFWATPVVGLGVLPWTGLLPTPFGILYYLFGLWTDDFLPEKPAGSGVQSLVSSAQNPSEEICRTARSIKNRVFPKINTKKLYDSEYK